MALMNVNGGVVDTRLVKLWRDLMRMGLTKVEQRVWSRWHKDKSGHEVLAFKIRHNTETFGLIPGGLSLEGRRNGR